MNNDALVRLAMARAIADSADIEAQLIITKGCRPIVSMLLKARAEAADALARLADVAPGDTDAVRALQTEVYRFRNLVRWLSEIVAEGFAADQEITAADREELTDLLSRSPEGQQEINELGLAGVNTDA